MSELAPQNLPVNIEDEMKRSYMDYAMSVIIGRALPDARDGLKPAHRRVLYGMKTMGLSSSRGYRKCAKIVGEVMGNFHPHGDASIYDTLVRLAQDFNMRYPLVDGQGNFGSIDGDPAAAMRYTEARLKSLADDMMADLDKETVDFSPNYDETTEEPTVLPTPFPNLLVNGSAGIAVGMATNVPPHNLTEVLDGCIWVIENTYLAAADAPRLSSIDKLRNLVRIVTGPDFPTAGYIIGHAGIRQAYLTGRGSLTIRSKCEIEEDEKGREAIVVTEIPYQVNKVKLISHIAELVREKKIEGISDIQDYSDRTGMRIWIQVKRDAAAQVVLNTLYKMSDLQITFGVNMIAIVHGRPQLLSLRDCLGHFIDHRRTVVTRRSRFELHKALERREIVEGLGVAIDAIDRIIALIRASKDPDEARVALCSEPLSGFAGFLERCGRPQAEVEAARVKPYRLNQRQAKAILDMRLQRLTGLEREKVEGEYRELSGIISYLESILADPALLMKVIRDELSAIGTEYGDARRTLVVEDEGEIEPIDLVADEPMIVMLTNTGYIKRLPSHEYRVQGRGGVGVKGGVGRDTADFVTELFEANAHSHVLLFTNTGRMFHTRVFELPQGRRESAGKALVNFLDLREGERVLGMVPYRDEDVDDGEHYIVMISAQGYIKRTKLDEFSNIRSTGIIAATIEEDDQLIDARLTNGKRHIMLTSARGMAIRFEESEVRPMGRTARGVRGMDLRTGDQVVGMTVLDADTDAAILTMCAQGFGKRTAAEDYKVQGRGGKGIITIKVNGRNGPVVGSLAVQTDDQIMVVTSKGKVIRTRVSEISTVGRNTMGVRVIRTGEDERVVAIERLVDQDDASVEEAVVPVEAPPEDEPEANDGDE